MKKTLSKRVMSIILCLALLMAYLPAAAYAAADATNRVADLSTMDGWKQFFLPDTLNTENAGGVWTDKSVFTDASAFSGTGITQEVDDSFLVALSAIASNMTVTGMSNVPTDTMLVLDVSGSMNDNDGNNDVAEELVDAANESIKTLLDTNKHNRVGVVLYSGPATTGGATSANDAVLILPLGRYTTGSDGAYLSYSVSGRNNDNNTETVSLDNDVRYEGTSTRPTSVSKTVVGGTYIQKGINLAAAQFTAATNSTTVEDPVLGTLIRKPILVLMSDGAPTVATTAFTDPAAIQLGDGTYTNAAIGFVTQLTAAYAKARIEAKYDTDSLFYTLGLGTTDDTIATSVLDPANSTTAIDDFWTLYNNADEGETVTVQGSGRNVRRVTKVAQTLEQAYVDKYFAVAGTSVSLAQGLKDAFADIVGSIQLQSRYFPTLVGESEDLSGYISFVDKIGQYMEVTDIKGILINNTLYSGADLAKNFVTGGGDLGTYDQPTTLGDEMVWAVQARLGLESADAARTLIGLAYEYGQLSYTSDTDYSNYIGWYANAAGQFLGFWHEGITTMPEPTGDAATDPAYIIKSYGYLGAVDESHGVAASDMMYATVQVRQSIATDEQAVVFAVPAALVPIVTYQVTLDQNNNLSGLTATGAEHPIRLVYEVALDAEIDTFNLKDSVSAEYLAANTDDSGNVSFYTNQYEVDNSTGYDKVNTYSYFNPSRQNDKYYYLEDAPVYTDTNGTLYMGDTQPNGTYYRAYIVYEKDGAALNKKTIYRRLSDAALSTAKQTDDGFWYIGAGNVHVNLDGYTIAKTENTTGTLPDANIPFVDAHGHSVGDLGYSFIVGATLGNNGKLTVAPETGIALSKAMAEDAAAPTSAFQFTITNTDDATDDGTYPARVLHADGTESISTVQFSTGKATVALNAGETIYIGGMTAGTTYTVEEVPTIDYIPQVSTITVTLERSEMTEVRFINSDRGTGNLTISKEVIHSLGSDYAIPHGKRFTIDVTLTGVGVANASFDAAHTDGSVTPVTTDANGSFTVTLGHDEQIEIFGLPTGTTAVVTERDPGTGFTAAYWENGQIGDGEVIIPKASTASVIVTNSYESEEVSPVNVVIYGRKNYTTAAADWNGAVFEFQLQKWTEGGWSTIATATATESSPTFNFNAAMKAEKFTAPGIYYYQVLETYGGQTINGITYDATLHTFGISVTDKDMDGKLEIDKVTAYHTGSEFSKNSDGDWQIDIIFNNEYNATGSNLVLDVQKELTNKSGSPLVSLSGFRFGLYDGNGLFAASDLTDGVGEARFVLHYELKDVGTHTYTLKEIVPDSHIKNMTYDTATYTVVVEVTDNGDGTTSAAIVSIDGATDYATPIFTNVYDPVDTELEIDFVDKKLTGRDLVAGEFTFELRGTNSSLSLTGANDADGNVIFRDKLYFDKVGTWFYDLVETTTDGKGVATDKTVYNITITVTDENGQLVADHHVLNVVGDTVLFENTYTAKQTSYTISGKKILNGRVLLNDEFTFVLTDADGKVIDESKNFTNGTFSFAPIPFTGAGTYTYTVSEKATSGAAYGIIYDATAYEVTITVTDDLEGNLVVSDVTTTGGESDAITFTNNYVPNSTTAAIAGNKTLTGKVLSGGDFSFELYESDENWTEGDKLETVENGTDGSFTFSEIDYETAGIRYYLVKEVYGGQTIDGVTYDDNAYRVAIEISDDLLGQLHATIHIYDNEGIPQQGVEFLNTYAITGDADVTLEGTKTLNGRDLVDGEFTFELYETDETFTVSGEAIKTAVNADGKFELNLSYTAEDVGNTYHYVVKEQNAGQTINGVTYSSAEYCITVVVEDNGTGGIKTSTSISSGVNSATSLDFVNDYAADEVSVEFSGTKALNGRDLHSGEFTFELYETNDSWFQISDALTVTNAADGSFAFEPITFTTAGTRYYIIREANSGETINGVTYDDTIYCIIVDVTDDLNGQLAYTLDICTSQGAPRENITFENIFAPDPDDVTLEITAEKTVKNTGTESIGPEGFEFLLENMTIGDTQSVKSDAEGLAVFTLTFTKDDIGKLYTYKLSEVNDGRANVEYSTAVYNITVAIELNEENKLVATITNNGVEVAEAVAEFENIYDYTPDSTPDNNPQTSDTSLALWIAMLAVSCGGVVTLTAYGKKEQEDDE